MSDRREHVFAALVHGSGYERIRSPDCPDRTIRRRLHEWASAGLAEQVQALALAAYDRMIGRELGFQGAIAKLRHCTEKQAAVVDVALPCRRPRRHPSAHSACPLTLPLALRPTTRRLK